MAPAWSYRAVAPIWRAMLRISELKLPLGHEPAAIAPAVAARLGIDPADLLSHCVARRAHDARRKSAILSVYSIDVAFLTAALANALDRIAELEKRAASASGQD